MIAIVIEGAEAEATAATREEVTSEVTKEDEMAGAKQAVIASLSLCSSNTLLSYASRFLPLRTTVEVVEVAVAGVKVAMDIEVAGAGADA